MPALVGCSEFQLFAEFGASVAAGDAKVKIRRNPSCVESPFLATLSPIAHIAFRPSGFFLHPCRPDITLLAGPTATARGTCSHSYASQV
jgi:hypothetical protein